MLNLIRDGYFSHGDLDLFKPLLDHLIYSDEYFVLADYNSYLRCQETVSGVWKDKAKWARMSIINTARMGYFSSDRSIEEYCDRIWKVRPIDVAIQNNMNVDDLKIDTLGECKVTNPMQQSLFIGDEDRILFTSQLKKLKPYIEVCGEIPSFEMAGPRKKFISIPPKSAAVLLPAVASAPGLTTLSGP